jgi:hypothetical protein
MKRDKWEFKPTEQQALLDKQITILARQFQADPREEFMYYRRNAFRQ